MRLSDAEPPLYVIVEVVGSEVVQVMVLVWEEGAEETEEMVGGVESRMKEYTAPWRVLEPTVAPTAVASK